MTAAPVPLRLVPPPDAVERLAVLLVEDSRADAQLIASHLETAGVAVDLTRVQDELGLDQALEQRRFDIVLSDYNIPGFNGLAALAMVRQAAPEMPFLFVSGALGEERAIELLKRGATDYILKDRLERLAPCVERAMREARERAELRRAQAERERLMQRADAERERLHTLFMQAPAAICMVSGPAFTIVLANPLFRQLVPGASRVGRGYREVAPAWAGHDHFLLLEQAFRTGELLGVNEVPIPFSGAPSERYFNFAFQPTRDTEGTIDGVLIHAMDATDAVVARRQVEALALEVQRREARARTLIAALEEGVVVHDLHGRLQESNASAERILGVPPGSLVGTEVGEIGWQAIQEDGTPWPAELNPAMLVCREGTAQVGKVVGIRTGKGELVWLTINSHPLFDPETQALTGAVTSFFDLTERKALEAELQTRADFEQLLVGIVSHDLKGPLSAIRMTGEILAKRRDADEKLTRQALRILSSTDRATRLISNLLDFTQARLGSGIRVDWKPTDLHALVRETVDELHVAWPDREVRVECQGEGLGRWDADRLAQVVQNLVTNALQYGPPEQPVSIQVAGDASDVSLTVHNSGPLIPSELLPQIFKALKRGDQTDDKRNRSVGLGLFIVHHLVEAHGGSIVVRSTAEEGTSFVARLPRA